MIVDLVHYWSVLLSKVLNHNKEHTEHIGSRIVLCVTKKLRLWL